MILKSPVLTGEWKIKFTNDAVRVYIIEKSGKLSGTADEAKLKGQITRKDGMLLLTFEGSDDGSELGGQIFARRHIMPCVCHDPALEWQVLGQHQS